MMFSTLPPCGRAARRALVLVALITIAPSVRAQAASSVPRPPKIETLANRAGVLMAQGAREIGTVAGRAAGGTLDSGSVAVEIRRIADVGTARKVFGLALIVDDEGSSGARMAWIDYDEIDGLLGALDSLAKADTATSPFAEVTTFYRTRGRLVVSAFRDVAPWASVGVDGPSDGTVPLPRQRLGKLRALVQRAQHEIDAIRSVTGR